MTRVIPRSEWGARYRDGFGSRSISGITSVWLHHSVTAAPPANASFAVDCVAVRNIEAIGQSRFAGGISYTYVITPSGRIFQGHSLGRIGAHTAGYNTKGVGICLVGNYENQHPTDAQIWSVVWLLQSVLGRNLSGGHRDTKSTACPGRNAYSRIPGIKAAFQGAAVPVSTPPTKTPAPRAGTGVVLRRGSTGANVGKLQAHLNKHYPAYSKLAVDNSFGPATERVVKEFQRRSFITVDGVVGPITQSKLGISFTNAPPAPPKKNPTPVPAPSFSGVLRRGSTGTRVRNLQSGLNRSFPAYSKLAVDGRFGPATERVVREFQRRAGLAVDGLVGPKTTAALNRYGISF